MFDLAFVIRFVVFCVFFVVLAEIVTRRYFGYNSVTDLMVRHAEEVVENLAAKDPRYNGVNARRCGKIGGVVSSAIAYCFMIMLQAYVFSMILGWLF